MFLSRKIWLFISLCLLLLVSMIALPTTTNAEEKPIEGSYGGKSYLLYVPSDYDENKEYPLYVMLHGCSQDADSFMKGTQMNALAEKEDFLVLYPDNKKACWNWFLPQHQERGSGEPSVIAGMVQATKSSYSINNEQVFVGGLSAGGAMSVILGATYPDVFSGVAVGSGLEYKAAHDQLSASSAMWNGGPDPILQGRKAYKAMGDRAKVMPVIVFHGTEDWLVRPINGEQVTCQWAKTNDLADNGIEDDSIDCIPDKVETFNPASPKRSYTVSDYEDQDGTVWIRKVIVDKMGHAWSGGSLAGNYTDPNGPDASRMMWEFFSKQDGVPKTIADPKGGFFDGPVDITLKPDRPAKTYYTLDGSEPDENSPVYSEPIHLTETTTLKFFSKNSVGAESTNEEKYIINIDDVPKTLANPKGGTFIGPVDITLTTNVPATTYYTLDGSEPTLNSAIYTEPIQINENTTLKFFSQSSKGIRELENNKEEYIIEDVDVVPITIANPKGGKFNGPVDITLTTNVPATTYYTLDGSEPTLNSAIYTEPIQITENTTLKFFSQSSKGIRELVNNKEEYNIEGPSIVTVLKSIGEQDGFVGQFTADGKSNGTIKVGDKGMYNTDTYRGILSFNTSVLSEEIHTAKLRLYTKSFQGNISSLQLDIKTGVFGNSSLIEQIDYSSVATTANIVQFNPNGEDYIEVDIPLSSLSKINLDGTTQFRLKAISVAGFNSNFIEFYGGESAEYAPQLIINDAN